MLTKYDAQINTIHQHDEEFKKEVESASVTKLNQLIDFASRAYRRTLNDKEKSDFAALYQALRGKGMNSDDALRGVLARIFVAPSFLFKIAQPTPGKNPGPVNDWELATRLSYFLWSSIPDDELRQIAPTG